jgi:O-antigen/teichoic acid export membrane protein
MPRDAALLFAGQCFFKATGVLVMVILSRSLPAQAIGVFFFATALAETFTTLANFRLDLVVMRRVAADPQQAGALLAGLMGFRLATSLPYLACVAAASAVVGGPAWPVVLGVALFTLLDDVYSCFAALFLGLGKASFHVAVGVAVQALYLGVLGGVMLWKPSLEVLVGANLFRSLLLVVVAVLLARRHLCPVRIAWDAAFVREGVPFIVLALIAALRGKMDTLLLGLLIGYRAVGLFDLALRIVTASFFFPLVFCQLIVPRLAVNGLDETNQLLAARIVFLLGCVGLLGSGVVALFAKPLTSVLYGSLSSEVAPVLRGLAILFPLGFVRNFLFHVLQGLHCEQLLVRVSIVMFAVATPVTWMMVTRFGVFGAVATRVIMASIMTAILGWCLLDLIRRPQEQVA